MLLATLRQRDTPAGDLGRVLAAWLVVILLAQGLAALQTLVRGPAHRHLTAAVSADPAAAWRTVHDTAHQRAHALGEAHHHAARDVAVPAEADAGLDAAACVLMAALAALAMSTRGWSPHAPRGASAKSVPWALADREEPPPRRPPRG